MAIQHAQPGDVVELGGVRHGPSPFRTSAIVKSDRFEAIRLAVPMGAKIAAHQVEGPITLHCLEGQVIVGLPEADAELAAGQWMFLAGSTKHSVRGVADSLLLLTVIF